MNPHVLDEMYGERNPSDRFRVVADLRAMSPERRAAYVEGMRAMGFPEASIQTFLKRLDGASK